MNNHNSTPLKHASTAASAYERLLYPTPESLPLIVALQLLQPQQMGDTVYLLPVDYVQNYLYWAFHQKCISEREQVRAREALKHAAIKLKLIPPTHESAYNPPGPINASKSLAVQGHPLVLQPTVRLHGGTNIGKENGNHFRNEDSLSTASGPTGPSHQRSVSHLKLPPANNSHRSRKSFAGLNTPVAMVRQNSSSQIKLPPAPSSTRSSNGVSRNALSASMNKLSLASGDHEEPITAQPECLAVPEAFYSTLRSIHGVVCQDGYTVSFQAPVSSVDRQRILLHHEPHHNLLDDDEDDKDENSYNNSQTPLTTTRSSRDATPVEFRRKVISQVSTDADLKSTTSERMSLMDRLMVEEERRQRPHVAVPEIHPIKLLYRIQRGEPGDDQSLGSNGIMKSYGYDGFVLVSQEAVAVDALSAMVRAAAPKAASQTVRLWSRYLYPWEGKMRPSAVMTDESILSGSGTTTQQPSDQRPFELIDFAQMTQQDKKAERPLTIGDWARRHTSKGVDRQIECLVELRPNISALWPRQSLVLNQRFKIGDFCDAQDVAGKWFEARICHVDSDSVTVHYFGWASRWNTKLKRWPTSTIEGLPNKLHPPAPLWSQTPRWRERIQIGDIIEVRDTSSLVHRPKWYKGEVKLIGKPQDPYWPLEGGADLELYPLDTNAAATASVNISLDNATADDTTRASSAGNKNPLILLDRGQQILVEVAQERTEKAGAVWSKALSSVSNSSKPEDLEPDPPFLRWVDLYGEEICQLGTHLKMDNESKLPSTLKYELEQGRKPVEIMKSHPSLGGAGFMRESLRGAPPAPGSVGLHNLGNSCFLNATVQCLNHMELITQYFLRDQYRSELNRQNPLGSGGNVVMSYASLIKKMWSGDYSVLAPRSLKQTVAAFAPQFDNSYQHDSQEFCQFLMDGLHEDLNRVKTKPYVEELEGFGMNDQQAAIESWRKHLLRHDSIFVDHCQGMHRSHLTCPQCGRESIKFDIYSSISVPLASKKEHSTIQLEDCIEMFMQGEQLDERNAWYCPNCRRHVCALKLIALWSAPDILILHLKRFQFDALSTGGMLRSKIDDTVDFPIEGLDLSRFILGPIDPEAPPTYRLFGVCEHTGYTANSGHYTATVRNSIDGQWYRCNDSNIGRTSGEAAITGGAYVLFYQREKGTSRWAGMENVMNSRRANPYGEEDQDGFKQVKGKKKKK